MAHRIPLALHLNSFKSTTFPHQRFGINYTKKLALERVILGLKQFDHNERGSTRMSALWDGSLGPVGEEKVGKYGLWSMTDFMHEISTK